MLTMHKNSGVPIFVSLVLLSAIACASLIVALVLVQISSFILAKIFLRKENKPIFWCGDSILIDYEIAFKICKKLSPRHNAALILYWILTAEDRWESKDLYSFIF